MAVFYDITKTLSTAFCSECSSWFACADTPALARKSAAAHEAAVHPEVFQVRNQVARHAREDQASLPKS